MFSLGFSPSSAKYGEIRLLVVALFLLSHRGELVNVAAAAGGKKIERRERTREIEKGACKCVLE